MAGRPFDGMCTVAVSGLPRQAGRQAYTSGPSLNEIYWLARPVMTRQLHIIARRLHGWKYSRPLPGKFKLNQLLSEELVRKEMRNTLIQPGAVSQNTIYQQIFRYIE